MNSKLTWWFKIVHGIAGIWWRRRLCMEKKNEYMRKKKGKQGRDRNFVIRFVIFQGGKICVCQLRLERQAERPAGRLLPFIGRQINRGGPPGARRATISV